MTRRSYTREFKAEAVRLVNDQGLSCAEAARDLGLHPSVLYRWVKEYGGDSHPAFPGHGQQGARQAEITSLRREVRKLKADAYFTESCHPFHVKAATRNAAKLPPPGA